MSDYLTLDGYQKLYNEDFKIKKESIVKLQMDLPILYNKYLRYYYLELDNYKKAEIALNKLYKDIYYDYKENFKYPLNNSECRWHTECDDKYSELYYKIQVLKQKVEYLEKVIKQIPYLTNAVKNIIEMVKFENGS